MGSCFCRGLQSRVVCTCRSSWEVGVGVVNCSVLFFAPVRESGAGVGVSTVSCNHLLFFHLL